MLTHLSLFSGIGGLDLAAEWAGFQTVGQCEFADYPIKVLEKHWPKVPRWRDIRSLTGGDFFERTGKRTVDIISGWFPCQPFSVAGKRCGKKDDRYLWPEMLRVISELRPTWVVGENVAGIISMALDTTISDLENQGYAVQAIVLPACAVGAPHQRNRVAIVAYSKRIRRGTDNGQPNYDKKWNDTSQKPAWRTELRKVGSGSSHVSDADSQGRERERSTRPERLTEPSSGDWWDIEPNVGRVAYGVPSRVDRLKCLGNAVVPQQFYPIFQAIADIENLTDGGDIRDKKQRNTGVAGK